MGKHWDNDTSIDSYNDRTNYNAVQYIYKDKVSTGRKYGKFDNTNSLKFRDVLKRNRLNGSNVEKKCLSSKQASDDAKGDCEDIVSTETLSDGDETLKKKEKKLKKQKKVEATTNQNDVSPDENGGLVQSDASVGVTNCIIKKKKKKKKSSNKKDDCEKDVTDDLDDEIICSTEKSSKSRKKRHNPDKQKSQNSDTSIEDVCISPEIKKKSKKSKIKTEDCAISDNEVRSSKKKKIKEKRKNHTDENKITEQGPDTVSCNTDKSSSPHNLKTEKKSSKKKKKDKTQDNDSSNERCLDVFSTTPDEDRTSKSKGKKKKRKAIENNISSNEMVDDIDVKMRKNKKRVTEEIETPDTCSVKKSKKKKKKDRDNVESIEEDSSEIPNSPKTKCKSKKRRHIDSTKEEDADTVGKENGGEMNVHDDKDGMGVTVGQWSTAKFDSEARQGKFMRLMGGLKASAGEDMLTNSGTNPNSPRANCALTTEQEKKLNKGLENQYDTALNWMIEKKKGCGLGFQKDPAEGKKFHIHANKSASKKFDD